MTQENIRDLIQQANQAEFHPSQIAFASAAKDFVHSPAEEKPKKYYISGRHKRHNFRKAKGVKAGFGKSYSSPEVVFRVEFSWVDPDGEESNEQVHWVKCRKLQGKEYQFIRKYFEKEKKDWIPGETVESEFVLRYVIHWLILHRDEQHLNQAFIFPAPKIGNETIRAPLYEVRWTLDSPEYKMHSDLAIILKKSIWHEW